MASIFVALTLVHISPYDVSAPTFTTCCLRLDTRILRYSGQKLVSMFTRMPWVVPKPPLLMVGMLSEALNKLQPGP